MPKKKLLVVQIAALGWDLLKGQPGFHPAKSFFPAVTCSSQASFRTASNPQAHGMIGNGLFFRDLRKVLFWEQSAALVQGERIWKKFRAAGKRVGMMFWQQSLGEEVDLVLSPAPIHKHEGGMIQDCYAKPHDLYARVVQMIGRKFNLMHYWGPLASKKATDWIVDATCAVMRTPDLAPDLLFSYLPHLDYDLQRYGPESAKAHEALKALLGCLEKLKGEAAENNYDYLFVGDYAIEAVRETVFPNRRLREAGLFVPRTIKGMAYTDFYATRAFAMVDHQIAHLFTQDAKSTAQAKEALQDLPGIAAVLDREEQRTCETAHPNSGDLLLISRPGAWFAYPWWNDKREAPDYATHVDIHNKPGYDPCELFFGWPPLSVSMDTARIRGSHGRPNEQIAWNTSLDCQTQPISALDIARFTQASLDAQA